MLMPIITYAYDTDETTLNGYIGEVDFWSEAPRISFIYRSEIHSKPSLFLHVHGVTMVID